MIFATIDGGLLLVVYCQESLRVSHRPLFSRNFFLSLLKQMSVVSAKDQTARDRSPVHGLRGFVCFRESRFVTCVDKPVLFQHCTATILCYLKPISYVSTMARSSSSFVSHSTVRTKSATQSSPFATTSASLPMN